MIFVANLRCRSEIACTLLCAFEGAEAFAHKRVYETRCSRYGSLPSRRNATNPRHTHPARRFAPRASDTTQADDSKNRLPALSMYD